MKRAQGTATVIPAFNIPYLPMMKPVIESIIAQDTFALIEVARLEWIKFEAKSTAQIYDEFEKYADKKYVRLHLDHTPVVDEDYEQVDFLEIIGEAINIGYESVMVDGSRLSFADNVEATKKVAALAHHSAVPCEAELGAVLGHEKGPLPPYEQLFASKRGFTAIEEARRFVEQTQCDWLSIAAGNIHGAVSGALKNQRKVEARLDVDHVKALSDACGVPLVLHGGSGIKRDYVRAAVSAGISKVNVGTAIRQPYEQALRDGGDIAKAQGIVAATVSGLICDYFGIAGSASVFE